jgi:serine/threonine-protein kinase RsbW
MTPSGPVRLDLPSQLELLDMIQQIGEQLASLAGFSDEQKLDVGLALREGAINAIKHGNGLDARRRVQVRIEVTEDDRFRMAVRDEGTGFDPETTPDPTDPANLWRTNGRGLLLIRSLVDDVEFVQHDPGMEIVLTKEIPKPPKASSGEVS